MTSGSIHGVSVGHPVAAIRSRLYSVCETPSQMRRNEGLTAQLRCRAEGGDTMRRRITELVNSVLADEAGAGGPTGLMRQLEGSCLVALPSA